MIDGSTVSLPRLSGVATAHVEWNHCLSACDVLLGAFRYCVNRPGSDVSKEMFPGVIPLLWHRADAAGRRFVRDYGLILRPKDVRADRIRRRYDWLVAALQRLADDAE